MKREDVTLICCKCETSFVRRYSYARNNKSGRVYCSMTCRNTHLSVLFPAKGRKHSEATKSLMSSIRIGKIKANTSNFKRGSDHYNWKGGVTTEHETARKSMSYKRWRREVYERDNHTCVLCGEKGTGKNLNADHIKPFSLFPDLRFDVDNGRTLCVTCHKKTPTYGSKLQKNIHLFQ